LNLEIHGGKKEAKQPPLS